MKTTARLLKRHARGFTLVELMVTIGVAAILAGIAAPGYATFIATSGAKNAAMQLTADLSAARSEALKRNTNVVVAPVASDWRNGWTVTVGGSELFKRNALANGVTVSAPTTGVTFLPTGRIDENAIDSNARWQVSATTSGVTPRCILLTPTGAARSKQGAC